MRMLYAVAALALAIPAAAADKKVDDATAKAESQIAKGRTDEAEKTMEKLVQQVPTAEAHAARARVQLRLGNVDGAGISAAEAVKLAPSAPPDVKARALTTVAVVDLERGSARDAVAHAQEAAAAAPSAATLSVLARAQARLGDPAAADTARKAVDAEPQNAAGHEAMGYALLSVGRGEEAVASFRKALELDVKRSSARVGLASALVATGKAAEAVTEARKATEEDARSGEAFAVLGTAIMAAAAPKDRETAWGEAIAQAQQGAFLSPRNTAVQYAVGKLFEAGGNLDQAAKTYRGVLQVDPGHAQAQMALLEIESRKGDVASALPRVQEMIKQQPQNAGLQYMLGKLLARKGDWQEAIDPLQKAAAGMANVAEVHALLGTAYQYNGQSAEALAAYKKAVALAPTNLDYRTTYGLLLGLNNQHADAAAELQKVTSTPGYKDAAGWVNLGWVYRNFEPEPKAEEAMTAYRKALELDPKNSQAALGLAWAALVGRKYDEALAAFTKAMELDKANSVVALNGIGWAHYFKKDMAKAEAFFKQASTAGRGDARLAEAIKNYRERGEAELERQRREQIAQQRRESEGGDVDSLCSQLQRGSIAAARKLGGMGAPAAQCLVYTVSSSQNVGLKQAAATALGNIGGAARAACPHLAAIARSNPYEQTVMDAKTQDLWIQWEDLRRAAKTAMGRIGC